MSSLHLQGGVGLRLRVYDQLICFVNCHLAAHLEAVNKRNADFDHIFRTMTFGRSTQTAGMVRCLYLSCSLLLCVYLFWLLYSFGFPWLLIFAAGVSSANQAVKNSNVWFSFLVCLILLSFGLGEVVCFSPANNTY